MTSCLAHRELRHERPEATLATTALVHEAYLRLVDQNRTQVETRAHFLNIAAQMMRRVVVDAARKRHADKRNTLTTLGRVLGETRRRDEARGVLTEAVAIAREQLPERHSRRLAAEAALLALGNGS